MSPLREGGVRWEHSTDSKVETDVRDALCVEPWELVYGCECERPICAREGRVPSSWWNYNTDINMLGSIDFSRNWRSQYRSFLKLSRETSLELITDIINPAYSIHSEDARGLKQKLIHWVILLFMCTCRCY